MGFVVQKAIEEIVEDASATWDRNSFWPAHPQTTVSKMVTLAFT
jgi:hypothetical protein